MSLLSPVCVVPSPLAPDHLHSVSETTAAPPPAPPSPSPPPSIAPPQPQLHHITGSLQHRALKDLRKIYALELLSARRVHSFQICP
jgi:hypothetical protein